MQITISIPTPSSAEMALGVAVSLLFHVAMVLVIIFLPRLSKAPELGVPIMVDLAFEPPQAKLPVRAPGSEEAQAAMPIPDTRRQIVSPPDGSEAVQAEPKSFMLSERDSTAVREQIKRGEGPDAGVPGKIESEKAVQPKAQQDTKDLTLKDEPMTLSQKDLKRAPLRLDEDTLADKFSESPKPSLDERVRRAVAGQDPDGDTGNLRGYEPFSRPFGTGARFLGRKGSADYLPHLPDGDITLLNTKANRFAVFVRRVALQVFSQLRTSGWDFLRAPDVQAISRDSTVLAVLSPAGKLLKVSLEDASGSSRFDQVLVESVRRGAEDPHPPPEAAADDGNIHFIFKARSWVQFAGDPRSGAPIERRWLVLATGLD